MRASTLAFIVCLFSVLRAILGQAQVLPDVSTAVRESLKHRPASWRAELIGVDLKHAGPQTTDLAWALRKAKPAPMSSSSRKHSTPSSRRGETLDEHALSPGTTGPGKYRILTLFTVDGHDFYFLCGATRLDGDELLTAGHCIYRLDPNGDGDHGDARWATRAWVWPDGRELSGAQSASRLAAHQEWITRGASDQDVGVVTVPGLSPVPSPADSGPGQ